MIRLPSPNVEMQDLSKIGSAYAEAKATFGWLTRGGLTSEDSLEERTRLTALLATLRAKRLHVINRLTVPELQARMDYIRGLERTDHEVWSTLLQFEMPLLTRIHRVKWVDGPPAKHARWRMRLTLLGGETRYVRLFSERGLPALIPEDRTTTGLHFNTLAKVLTRIPVLEKEGIAPHQIESVEIMTDWGVP